MKQSFRGFKQRKSIIISTKFSDLLEAIKHEFKMLSNIFMCVILSRLIMWTKAWNRQISVFTDDMKVVMKSIINTND